MSKEDEKSLYENSYTRVPTQLVGNMGTSQSTAGTEKVQTCQNFTTVEKLDITRNTEIRDSGKKNQGTTRMKIIKINAII